MGGEEGGKGRGVVGEGPAPPIFGPRTAPGRDIFAPHCCAINDDKNAEGRL